MAGREQALSQAKELVAMCELAGTPHLLSGLIKAETAPDAARQMIIDAAASGSRQILSTVSPTTSHHNVADMLLANAKSRNKKA